MDQSGISKLDVTFGISSGFEWLATRGDQPPSLSSCTNPPTPSVSAVMPAMAGLDHIPTEVANILDIITDYEYLQLSDESGNAQNATISNAPVCTLP